MWCDVICCAVLCCVIYPTTQHDLAAAHVYSILAFDEFRSFSTRVFPCRIDPVFVRTYVRTHCLFPSCNIVSIGSVLHALNSLLSFIDGSKQAVGCVPPIRFVSFRSGSIASHSIPYVLPGRQHRIGIRYAPPLKEPNPACFRSDFAPWSLLCVALPFTPFRAFLFLLFLSAYNYNCCSGIAIIVIVYHPFSCEGRLVVSCGVDNEEVLVCHLALSVMPSIRCLVIVIVDR